MGGTWKNLKNLKVALKDMNTFMALSWKVDYSKTKIGMYSRQDGNSAYTAVIISSIKEAHKEMERWSEVGE
ncbi:hypothetical protein HAX54_039469, partial [Datura stramonium]|nr:hypothetical protein [Datura stramonium]